MRSIPFRVAVPLALAAAVMLTACSGNAERGALQQDSSLGRDLARAGVDSASQPQLKDVPAMPAGAPPPPPAAQPRPRAAPPRPTPQAPPSRQESPAPAPVPAAAPPTTGMLAAGTTLALTSSNKVCTNTNKVGDRFVATLNEAVWGTNNATLPAGSAVSIELTQLTRSENSSDKIVIGFRVVSIAVGDKTYYPDAEVVTAAIDRVRSQTTGDNAKKVVGGAVAGAIIGQILGRDRRER